LSNSY
jgi:EF-hand domain-containing protein 1